MPSYKNQHFVPRCYFRHFSLENNGLAINLFNIGKALGVRNAPLKNQCSGDYFYGEDLYIEKALQVFERNYAKTVSAIASQNYQFNDLDKIILRHFCYLQHRRTEAASQRAALMMSEMSEVAFRGDVPENWRTSMRDAVSMGIQAFLETIDIVSDLKVCLVLNRTELPFITSDDPAILTNRWHLQDPRARKLGNGIGSSGVLLFLPVTPNILCILYDGDTYTIPNQGGWVMAVREIDVSAFNEHQYLNCVSNIYFQNWENLKHIELGYSAALSRRPKTRHEIITAILDSEDEFQQRFVEVPRTEFTGARHAMLHFRTISPSPSRWPSLIHWRSDRKIYSNGSGTGFVRRAVIDFGFAKGTGYQRIR